MTDIQSWSPTESQNNDPAPDGFPQDIPLRDVDDSAREVMAAVRRQWNDAEWFNYGNGDKAPSYSFVSASVVRVVGGSGAVAEYHTGRRVRYVGTSTIYGTIQSSVVNAADLDVTVAWDSGSAINENFKFFLHILRADNSGLPQRAIALPAGTAASPSIVFPDGSGIYLDSPGQLGFSIEGAQAALLNAGGLVLPDGTAAAPALRGVSDTDSGIFFGPSKVAASTSAFERWAVGPVGQLSARFSERHYLLRPAIEAATTPIAAVRFNADDTCAYVRFSFKSELNTQGDTFKLAAGEISFYAARQANNQLHSAILRPSVVASNGGTPVPTALSLIESGNDVQVAITINNNGTAASTPIAMQIELTTDDSATIDVVAA